MCEVWSLLYDSRPFGLYSDPGTSLLITSHTGSDAIHAFFLFLVPSTARVKELQEPPGSNSIRRRQRSSSSSSAAGMAEHQVASSGVSSASGSASEEELGEGEMYEKCRNLRDAYKVVVGSTWGNLPEYLQPAWRAYDCDYYGRLSTSPVGSKAVVGNQAIA